MNAPSKELSNLQTEVNNTIGLESCKNVTYSELFSKWKNSTSAAVVIGLVLQMILGPGTSLLFFALESISPCIYRGADDVPTGNSPALWISVLSIYCSLWGLSMIRSGLYMRGVTFCSEADAKNHLILHVCFYFMVGLVLSVYSIYVFTLNVWAVVGSIIVLVAAAVVYVALFFEHHGRICPREHIQKNSNFTQHDWGVRLIEFLSLVGAISLVVCVYNYDGNLNTPFRYTLSAQGKCVAKTTATTITHFEFWWYSGLAILQLAFAGGILLWFAFSPFVLRYSKKHTTTKIDLKVHTHTESSPQQIIPSPKQPMTTSLSMRINRPGGYRPFAPNP